MTAAPFQVVEALGFDLYQVACSAGPFVVAAVYTKAAADQWYVSLHTPPTPDDHLVGDVSVWCNNREQAEHLAAFHARMCARLFAAELIGAVLAGVADEPLHALIDDLCGALLPDQADQPTEPPPAADPAADCEQPSRTGPGWLRRALSALGLARCPARPGRPAGDTQ